MFTQVTDVADQGPPMPTAGSTTRNAVTEFAIGSTTEGRQIRALRIARGSAADHLIVVAGQHGDEPLASDAANRLLPRLQDQALPPSIAIWIVPTMNPDGHAAERRTNADGIDLNRDHLIRQSVENHALHRFLNELRPIGLVDLHTFPGRRRWMKPLGVEHAADCMLDWPSGPAAALYRCDDTWGQSALHIAEQALDSTDLTVTRYWLRSPSGRIRHSTLDWMDLRNHVAAIHGCPTLLVEGQQPIAPSYTQAEQTVEAMTRITLAALCSRTLWRPQATVSLDSIPLQHRYQIAGEWATWMRDRCSRRIVRQPIPGRYSGIATPRTWSPVPDEFLIPLELTCVIEQLRRLDAPLRPAVPSDLAKLGSSVIWKRQHIGGSRHSSRPRRSPKHVRIEAIEAIGCIADDRSYLRLVDGPSRMAFWFSLLDPRSKYGLARLYPDELVVRAQTPYPILYRERTSHCSF